MDDGEEEEEEEEELPPVKPKPKKTASAKSGVKFTPESVVTHYNRQYWQTSTPVRDYKREYVCDDGEHMGRLLTSSKGWPDIHSGDGKPGSKQLAPAMITVLEGKIKEEDTDTVYTWYIRLVTREEGKQDKQILRHLPKEVFKRCKDKWSTADGMRGSQLLQKYLPTNDNERPLNPSVNGWSKIVGDVPKTACVPPNKEKKPKKGEEKKPEKKEESKPPPPPHSDIEDEEDEEEEEEEPAKEPAKEPEKKPKPTIAASKQSALSGFQKKPAPAKPEPKPEPAKPEPAKPAPTLVKRRLSEQTIKYEYEFTGPVEKLEVDAFEVPASAKRARVSVTFEFH